MSCSHAFLGFGKQEILIKIGDRSLSEGRTVSFSLLILSVEIL
jgi:hypothetical protein